MKAVKLRKPGGLEHLEYADVPDAKPPGPGEVVIKLEASSLNNHDLGIAIGRSPTQDGRILLSDGCGVIEKVGDGVHNLRVGEKVVSVFFPQWIDGPPAISNFTTTPGDGVDGYARERITVPQNYVTRAPKNLTALESATLPTAGVTAWRALKVNGALLRDQTILVQGTGGVSLFALKLALAFGAKVIATSSSEEKIAKLQALGATHTINYKETPNWGKKALDFTDGKGVDHVLEIGGAATLAQSVEATRVGGHIALIGVLSGFKTDLSFLPILLKQIRAQGCLVGSRRDQSDLINAIEQLDIKPVIDSTFRLDQVAKAFERQISGNHFGKIGIEIS